ncbi:MAG: helix-turn-helix transcriptional regulator [Solirubrobacteraceae bacterium]
MRVVMWLADIDVDASHGFAQALVGTHTLDELRRRTFLGLDELVPADVLMWDRVDLASGAVRHVAFPAEAEPRDAFEGIVGHAGSHPLLAAHAARRCPALRLSDVVESGCLSRSELYGELLHPAGVEYSITIGMRSQHREIVVAGLGRTEREFSERDRDLLDLVRPVLEDALRDTQAHERLDHARETNPPPGSAVVLLDRNGEIEQSSLDAERWLSEHFGPAEHPGWLPQTVVEWLALPPRPPLVSVRDGRHLTIHLLPGDPHALLLEEHVASFRQDALDRLGLTPREAEVLRAATSIEQEADIAWELCLSLHAVQDRLAHIEAKLGVHTAADAVAVAFREST